MNIKKQIVARMDRNVSPSIPLRTEGGWPQARGTKAYFVRDSKAFKKQRGISIIVVIFLLAGVSVMTLSMMNLSGTQQMSSLYAVRGAQAYFAARSGLEYAIDRITNGATCAGVASQNISGYVVNIACTSAGPFDEGNVAAPYSIYRLTATASRGNFQAPDVANREITVTVRNNP